MLIPEVICEITVGLESSPRPHSLPWKVAFPSWAVQGTVRGMGRDGKESGVVELVFLGAGARQDACMLMEVVMSGIQQKAYGGLLSGLEG